MIVESATVLPPGRRELRRASRREAILDVAQRSFLDNGYAATTMNAIAAELGGSKGTLWSYFPSKEQLFAAVLDRATASFRSQVAVVLNPDDPPEKAIRSFCRRFVERICQPESGALYRLVIGESQRFPEVGRIFYERAPAITRAFVADYLAGAAKRGQLKIEDSMLAAEQLTHMCLAGMHQRFVLGLVEKPSQAMIKAEADNAADLFLRAYG